MPKIALLALALAEPLREKGPADRGRLQRPLEPAGAATKVTWSLEGKAPFLAKVVHLFVDMDRMVGRDFEAGLANLKKLAEA